VRIDETRQEDTLPQILADRGWVPTNEIIPGSHIDDLPIMDSDTPVRDRGPTYRHDGPGTEQSDDFGKGHGEVLTQILQRNHDNRSGASTKRVARIRKKIIRNSVKERNRDDF
jgi:hypothetical protein